MASYDLKKAVEKIGKKRFNFALYKGEKERQIVIAPEPPGKALVEAAGCADLTRVTKGLCFWEKDAAGVEILFFAVKGEPQSTWKDLITKAFRSHKCESYLPVEMRSLRPDEPDEVSNGNTPEAAADTAKTTAPDAATAGASPTALPAAEFNDRLRAAVTKLKDPGLADAVRQRLTTLVLQAGDFARKSDLAGATTALLAVEQELSAPSAPQSTATASPARPPEETLDDSPAGRLARFGKAWSAARKKFAAELNRIEDAILETYKDAAKYEGVARQMPRLHALQKAIDKSLETQLASAASIPPEEADGYRKSLRASIDTQLAFVDGDPLMLALDDNPFHKTGIRMQLLAVLQKLESEVTKA
jgi:hypothetical protein